jgi:hypothetical protein
MKIRKEKILIHLQGALLQFTFPPLDFLFQQGRNDLAGLESPLEFWHLTRQIVKLEPSWHIFP